MLTAYITARNSVTKKRIKCNVLLDPGSMRTFVKREFSQKLGLKSFDKEVVTVSGFSQKRAKTMTYSIVELELQTELDTYRVGPKK